MAISKYNNNEYNIYCQLFIDKSNEIGRPLKFRELVGKTKLFDDIPDSRWFIKNCSDKSVVDYNSFLFYLGYKPRYFVPKDYTIKEILKKYNELKRPLKQDDFRFHDKDNEIGLGIIKHHWGNFNNMLKELQLPITQENMQERHKTLEELECDIKELCNFIYETKGIKNISLEDIDNCEGCLNHQAYSRYFKRHYNMTVGEYIKSIGFIPNESGMGMNYSFDDGENTTSQWEYMFSKYLRDKGFIHNIDYLRNIKYKTFITNYKGNKDCDYIFNINNIMWYVEIAGILDYTKQKKDTKVRVKYRKDLNDKIKLLKENNLNYKIIYPHELKSFPLSEVFYFLFE